MKSPSSHIIGTGGTPEGIDQNPAYYEFLHDQPFREEPLSNLTEYIVARSHQRYGSKAPNNNVMKCWTILMETLYATDRSVQDLTGVTHLQPRGDDLFEKDRSTPTPFLCQIYTAWGHLLQAGEDNAAQWLDGQNEPFRYDLVNLGREVLAQIATPMALNFTAATKRKPLRREEIVLTSHLYTELLDDIDELVATDSAFLLGPWLQMARRLGEGNNDCVSSFLPTSDCQDFLEWNARSQLSTWNPTSPNDTAIPGGPIDYASKHWAGLVKDYYAARARELTKQSLDDIHQGELNETAVAERFAKHSYEWTTMSSITHPYADDTVGDALIVSRKFYQKYSWVFRSCSSGSLHLTEAVL